MVGYKLVEAQYDNRTLSDNEMWSAFNNLFSSLKSTRASELIKLLVDREVIVPVSGHGKGKYQF